MSVFIKGLDIPIANCKKQIHLIISSNGLVEVINENNVLLAEYEAISIPTPHGRLIDADALLEHLGDTEYKGAVKRVLMQAPTVIEAEAEE